MARERDLFENFERMRREIDELFGDMWRRAAITPQRGVGFAPRVDVYYCDDSRKAVVKADLAGVDISHVQLDIRGRELTISGERKPRETEGRVYQQVEVESGPFRRTVQLGVDVDAERAKATYQDGILIVELPVAKSEGDVKRVTIEGSTAER